MSKDWFNRLAAHPDLLPPAEQARTGGRRLIPVLREYADAERLSAAELKSRQRMRLRALVRHSAEQAPQFAARLRAAGLSPEELGEPDALQDLPPLTRRDLVEAGDSLFCRMIPQDHGGCCRLSTSGSTGEPVTIRWTQRCDLHLFASVLRGQLWHGHQMSGRRAIQRARATQSARRQQWEPPYSLLFKTGPLLLEPPTCPVGELVDRLVEFSPQRLAVFPSALREIIVELERTGRRLPEIQDIRTYSETVTSELRAEVRRFFGREVVDSYGSIEAGLIATQCPEAGTYHVVENILLDVVDADGRPCAPGETGRVLVTHLLNYATPLIRYQLGDYAEVAEPCPCGRPFASIRRFLGRERNLLLRPDGTRHWPVWGVRRWAAQFAVRQFQFIQTDRRTMTAKMFADRRPTADQESVLTAILQDQLGCPFEFRYEWQSEPLPRGAGGKFEEFICRAT